MGLPYKPGLAEEGDRISNDQARTSFEEIEGGFFDHVVVATRDNTTVTSSDCSLTDNEETMGRLPSPAFPPRDGSPQRDDLQSLLNHRHPVLGPFEKFPGTQFWELYWHRKRMIKWEHWQLLTKTMSVWEVHQSVRGVLSHHENLLQSIDQQRRDGMGEDPLFYWLFGDHAQLLETSRFVLQYFYTVRVPVILDTQFKQTPPPQL
ncbi:unnamed protein product [Calypogeia fissa]